VLLLVSTADTTPNAPDVVATPDDRRIVAALLAGDERARRPCSVSAIPRAAAEMEML